MDGPDRQHQEKPGNTPPLFHTKSVTSNKDWHKNDIVEWTSLSLPSMSGFWSPPPSQASAEAPAQPQQERQIDAPAALPPAFPLPPIIIRQAANQTARYPRRPRLRRIALVLLLAILTLVFGTLAYQILAPGGGGSFSARNSTRSNSGTRQTNGGGSKNNAPPTPTNGTTQGGLTNGGTMPTTNSFQVGEHPLLTIKGHGNNVNIHTGEAGMILVTARYHNNGSPPVRGAISYAQASDGQGHDRITVMTNPGYMGIDYEAIVPRATQVQVEENTGSIDVSGISGIMIDTGSGNLTIEDVRGLVEAHTTSGDITIRALTGQITVGTENGSIRATGINGPLQAVTHNGDVTVRVAALYGSSLLETTSGSVRFEGSIDRQGNYQMKTISGDVDLTLPGDTAFQLDTATSSGAIHNAFGGTVIGNTPRAQIMANTTYGSVIIDKLT